MKHKEKVEAANKIVQFAKEVGFPGAYLKFIVDDEDEVYDSVEDVAANYEVEDEVTVSINLFLDDDLTFEIVSDDPELVLGYND